MTAWELHGLVTISAQSHGTTEMERKMKEKAYVWSKGKRHKQGEKS
jgi:hypothetical protein